MVVVFSVVVTNAKPVKKIVQSVFYGFFDLLQILELKFLFIDPPSVVDAELGKSWDRYF